MKKKIIEEKDNFSLVLLNLVFKSRYINFKHNRDFFENKETTN